MVADVQAVAPDQALPAFAHVRIEVPRGSLAKRDASGRIEFLSPLPCPFHYGSVLGVRGHDGDAQDALVLGPAGPRGSVRAWPVRARVRFVDEGLPDDKWVCSEAPLTARDERLIVAFFRVYGALKLAHDVLRNKRGPTGYRGFEHAQRG